ncbi:16S rRNA (uracil(1498)-N(3))-methyltransferase [Myroides sp. 1354]|uniref:16S rRNA (uracil(1498)-N(3))-methyltransferase n=1 Tax=unclassified Myroides TaxID=2642485 RepID=UPI002574ECA6|nr:MULTISPECIES: 16S rRNA (uracil(1498)-N(3))-methyltransferase [unclassified Myroides]MDM1045767.1 16S rRNA (uracil(1498)-N(3))-methyltransferase [Myroides sp. R163-1]MDM1055778.1 16S rRNA (uracil(1498)-N(3))-methyltransferase [Myroides sp. 1354]MDM1069870.1 16S rRNA (uracil(1498)-N(3))-methyltransferase [Myroides sp. 1372]
MQLFYSPSIDKEQATFTFDKDESKHIIRVLRKKEGDTLFVTNGRGTLFETKISLASDRSCLTEITGYTDHAQTPFRLHLAVAPTKMNERYEWFLEKATEIGIHEITPIICDHSERKVVKTERFEKIIQSAMKQSLQHYLPQLNEPITLKEFLKQDHQGALYIAHCEEDKEKELLKNSIQPQENYLLLVGPEGDFSPIEIKIALEKGFKPVSLGHTRLRTETAALVACHSFVFANE